MSLEANVQEAIEKVKKRRITAMIAACVCGGVGAIVIIIAAVQKNKGVQIGVGILGAIILLLAIWPIVETLKAAAEETVLKVAGFKATTTCDIACGRGTVGKTWAGIGKYSPVCWAGKKLNVCS